MFALTCVCVCVCAQYIHVVCAILLSSFSTYANANGGQPRQGQAAVATKKGAQKLKVIKNGNLMLLLPDSLTLCALTVVSHRTAACHVVSCLVFACLLCLALFFSFSFSFAFAFARGPQNGCRHHSLLSLRVAFIFWHKTGNDLCKMADAQLI